MSNKQKINNVFYEIQDDILDEYNKGIISKKEMINIIEWCQKMQKRLLEKHETI